MHNFFRLFAVGQDFDVDAYMEQSPLAFDQVWHRGEPRAGMASSRFPNSGCGIELGDGLTTPLSDQDRIAADFLETNEKPLRQLADCEGVEVVNLGLHYSIDNKPDVAGFCMSPSERLMYFSLRAGVTPVFYADLVRDHDRELIRDLANGGDARARYVLGYLHEAGLLGVEQDETEALRWYRAAAGQQHPEAEAAVQRLGGK